MNFGLAVEAMKAGKLVQRKGWNGKGMYVYLENGNKLPLVAGVENGATRVYDPVICMYTAQGTYQLGWLASQADILAEDWLEVA